MNTTNESYAIDKASDAFELYIGASVICTFAFLAVFVYLFKSFNRPSGF
jgi:hypothetical protein